MTAFEILDTTLQSRFLHLHDQKKDKYSRKYVWDSNVAINDNHSFINKWDDFQWLNTENLSKHKINWYVIHHGF